MSISNSPESVLENRGNLNMLLAVISLTLASLCGGVVAIGGGVFVVYEFLKNSGVVR